MTRQSGQCLSGLDSGAFFKRRGAARATPLGSVGLPVGVRTSIYRVRRNRRVGLRRHRPWGCESDAGKGHPQREYTDNVLNFQRKLHDLFHSHSPKTFVFRRNVLKIMSITFLLFPNYIALVPKRGEKEGRKKGGKNEKQGRNRRKRPCFAGFFPVFYPVSPFFFSPQPCLSVFSEVGSRGAQIFKFRKAHFRRFLYICTTISPLGDRFSPSKTTLE